MSLIDQPHVAIENFIQICLTGKVKDLKKSDKQFY